MRSGVGPVLLLLLAAVVATAQTPGPDFLPEREVECYDCHASEPKLNLDTLFVVEAPVVDVPADQESFPYTVTVTNTWLHEQRFLGPRLDLTDAPSLRFAGGREPLDAVQDGAVEVTPRTPEPPQGSQIVPDAEPTLGPYAGHVTFTLPEGATRVELVMEENSELLDPEVTWNLYTGREGPEGDPDRSVTSTGAPAELVLDDLAGLAFGGWTVQASLRLDEGDPSAGTVPFRVALHAEFDAERVSQLGRQLSLQLEEKELFTWTLERDPGVDPAPGEVVRLDVDGSAYYEHQTAQGPDGADGDWGHTTKGLDLALTPAPDGSGGVRLGPDGATPLVAVVPEPPGVALPQLLEVVGYVGGFLVLASMVSGGVFGKASRRQLNALFGTARRRVAFHNALSYALIAVALVHSVLFLVDNLDPGSRYHWTLGLLWGGVALLAMFGLGVTGALQVPLIRRWNYSTWRWVHLGMALGTLVFTLLHLLLDGAHFGAVQDWLGYRDPLDPRLD